MSHRCENRTLVSHLMPYTGFLVFNTLLYVLNGCQGVAMRLVNYSERFIVAIQLLRSKCFPGCCYAVAKEFGLFFSTLLYDCLVGWLPRCCYLVS